MLSRPFVTTTLATLLLATLAACGSTTQYIISTRTGLLIVAQGKPDFDAEEGVYTYVDAQGKETTIMREDVAQIMER